MSLDSNWLSLDQSEGFSLKRNQANRTVLLLVVLSSVLILSGCTTEPEAIDPIPLIDVSAAERVKCDRPQPTFSSNYQNGANLDAEIVADDLGVSPGRVVAGIAFRDAFHSYASQVREKYSDEISGIWAEPTPEQTGYIVFVNEVPDAVADELNCGRRLNPENVILVPGGQISEEDGRHRESLVIDATRELGYRLLTGSTDYRTALIEMAIYVPYGEAIPTAQEIASAAERRISGDSGMGGEGVLTGRAAEILSSDLDLIVRKGSRPISPDDTPLATWDIDSVGGQIDPLYEPRRIVITDHCIYGEIVRGPDEGEQALMVFRSDAKWNPDFETVETLDIRGNPVEVRDGDIIQFGGNGISRNPQYAIQPHSTCDTSEVWLLSGVLPLEGAELQRLGLSAPSPR